ncbi:hypothetical protein K525DRAFT_250738 [Schizophyllum commune Loenen D]|nr:hypothetical protein K525DRAFT_250738 [Schizophyllum commune Loenen D]
MSLRKVSQSSGMFSSDTKRAYHVRAGQREFQSSESLPDGWLRYAHPEGYSYFWHEKKMHAWRGCPLPQNYQLVVALESQAQSGGALYYLVDEEKQCIFWLEDHSLVHDLRAVQQTKRQEPQIIELYLRGQFFEHWALFPNVQVISTAWILRVRKALDDALTARHESAMQLGIQLDVDWLPGQMIRRISRRRHSTLRDLFRLLSIALFMEPQRCFRALMYTWVDDVLAQAAWKKFVAMAEWDGHRPVAALLLSANISLQSIDDLPDGVAKTASILSTISAAASIVLVTAFEGRIRRAFKHDIRRTQIWFYKLQGNTLGLEILSTLITLPYGLLLWSWVASSL